MVADIAGHDRQSVMKRGRRDDEIGLREGMSSLAAFLDEQPPFEHDILGNREHALLEHWPHLVRKPIIEFSATIGVRNEFDSEPDFGEGRRTDMEKIKRLSSNEGEDLAFWPGVAQFREYVGVEQPAVTKRPRAQAIACAPVQCRHRDAEKPALRRSTLRR